MREKGLTRIGRIADGESLARGLGHPAAVQIGARFPRAGAVQLQAEEARGGLADLGQIGAAVGARLRGRVARGHGQAGLPRQQFDRLHEGQVLGLAQEGQRVALRMAAEAVIEPLAVIDMEGGGLFLVEGAGRPEVPLALIRLAQIPGDLAPDHLRDRDAAAQIVQKSGRKAHAADAELTG